MPHNYLDNYYGSILDPLHGNIKLSEIEKWCISQPIFSRLRRVKQNTFLYYVFPSANHTRFEHSIAVMHLSGKIFESCKENFASGDKKRKKYGESEQSSFFDLNALGEKEEEFYQELRLAGLLHDIGHGPLSHLFDEFAMSAEAFMCIINGSEILKKYKDGFLYLITENNNKVEHEIISCAFIFKLIHELKQKDKEDPNKFSSSTSDLIKKLEPEHIVKIIEPNFPGLPDYKDVDGNNCTPYFSRIVTAFPIDADRMDYLLRDSYFSGVTYGIYDINRVFSSFLATKNGNEIHLAFKESGLDSVLRFIQSRTHLYNQVYFHKTNRAANTMLAYATGTKRNEKIKILDKIVTLDLLCDFYIENSDEYFLNDTVINHLIDSDVENNVLTDLIERKLFKRVFQEKIVLFGNQKDQRKKIKEITEKINIKLKTLISNQIIASADYYENVTFKDSDKKVILVALKNEKGKYDFKDNWVNLNAEFLVSNLSVSMVRIYLKRNFNSPDEFKEYKKRVNETVAIEIDELKKMKNITPELEKIFQ